MTWSPDQYLKFAGHRLRPALDLLARVPLAAPSSVVDLGAGTGNVTAILRQRWPQAALCAVESSREMSAKGRAAIPQATWVVDDIAAWRPTTAPDVIFSNAALHWLGDHANLFPRLLGWLAPGGVLAVQMPRNFAAPSHTAMAEAAAAGPWRQRLLPSIGPVPVADPGFYHDCLAPRCAALDIWETEYLQVLSGDNPVVEWTKGTWLRPLLDALDEPQRGQFEKVYAELVAAAYPRRADGTTLFPFRRLFMVAVRGDG